MTVDFEVLDTQKETTGIGGTCCWCGKRPAYLVLRVSDPAAMPSVWAFCRPDAMALVAFLGDGLRGTFYSTCGSA